MRWSRKKRLIPLICIGFSIAITCTCFYLKYTVFDLTDAYQNSEDVVKLLYIQDQKERSGNVNSKRDWEIINDHDANRRQLVLKLIKENKIIKAEDFYFAAMIFQHGNSAEDAYEAHILAEKASSMNPKLKDARWLSA
ncbi:MAG: hypothetical protein ACREHG_04710, partial [Candidatus Saccharimonadales bacterium]